jgi:FKBP-type peptidyl-prolyl cis-trans isomerase 2
MRPDTHERGMFHGPNHLELIGAVRFRQVLGLQDESAVDVEVEGDDAWGQRRPERVATIEVFCCVSPFSRLNSKALTQ